MNAERWLLELRTELVRRKLPPRYVERMVSEMEDHILQLGKESAMGAIGNDRLSEQLGSPRQIARDARRELDASHFARRHPLLVFLVLPMLMLPVLTFLFIAVFTFAGSFLANFNLSQGFCFALWVFAFIVPTALLALAGGRFARRAGLHWCWPLATCVVLAALTSLFGVEIMPRPRPMGAGFIGDYFIVLNGPLAIPSLLQVIQTFVPLAVATCLWFWSDRKSAELSA